MARFPDLGVHAVVDGYNKFIDQVGGMATKTQETRGLIAGLGSVSLGGLVSGAGTAVVAIGAIGAAAVAAGLAVGGILFSAAKNAAPLFDIQQAFEGITAAAGKTATDVLKVWQDASRGTIPAIQLMEDYNTATSLLGTTLADQIPAVLPAIGKAAAATGQSVAELTEDFIRGISRGSVRILDNLGITLDLEKVYSDYAVTLGKTSGELSRTEQQTALLQAATKLLNDNTAAIPDVATTAAGDFARLRTTFQDTKDEILISLVPALLPLVEQFGALAKEHLPGLAAVFTTVIIPAIGQVASWLANNLPAAIATLQGWWAGLMTRVGEAANFWTTVLQPALAAVWAQISTFLAPILEHLARIWSEILVPALQLAWQWLSVSILPAIMEVGRVVREILGFALEVLWAFIVNKFIPAVVDIWTWISDKLAPVFEWLGQAIEAVGIVLQPVFDLLHDFGDVVAGLEIPEWLKGHSPSPFENTLVGIRDTLMQINSIAGPTLGAGRLSPLAVASAGATGGGGDTFNPEYNLAIHTSAPREQVAADFGLMQALSRRR
jgi:hypothetical protein